MPKIASAPWRSPGKFGAIARVDICIDLVQDIGKASAGLGILGELSVPVLLLVRAPPTLQVPIFSFRELLDRGLDFLN